MHSTGEFLTKNLKTIFVSIFFYANPTFINDKLAFEIDYY